MKFSVITVCYNDFIGLQRTINSVITQTCSDYEYIVIDGGSTDGSVEVIKQCETKITRWISEKDNGVYSGMNKAIVMAQGEYCIFMNAGDTFYSKDVLQQVFEQLPNIDLAVGVACMVKDGEEQSRVNPPQEVSLAFWLFHSVIHQAAFMKTRLLKEKMYDEKLKIVSDWKYMLTEYLTRSYTYSPLSMVVCCFDTTGISSNNERRLEERNQVLKDVLPPMLYCDYCRYDGFKTMAGDAGLMNNLNMALKHRTLVKYMARLIPVMTKLFIWLKKKEKK